LVDLVWKDMLFFKGHVSKAGNGGPYRGGKQVIKPVRMWILQGGASYICTLYKHINI
jgi:hypothetical protein